MSDERYDYVRPIETDVLPAQALNMDQSEVKPKKKGTRKRAPSVALHCWTFTYSDIKGLGRLPSHEELQNVLLQGGAMKYCFQLERGEKSGTLHYQGSVFFYKKRTLSSFRTLFSEKSSFKRAPDGAKLYAGGCLTIRPTHSARDSDMYCMKEDTRVEGPWYHPPLAYFGDDLIGSKKFPHPLLWQQEMDDKIAVAPDNRTVYCIVNMDGNVGKSVYAKTKGFLEDAVLVDTGLSASQMKAAFISLGPKRLYIVDLPRNGKDYKMLYDCIEKLKDGQLTSYFQGKYRSLYMRNPHIICFANEFPPMDCLSIDRWKLFSICPKTQGLWAEDAYAIRRKQRLAVKEKLIEEQKTNNIIKDIVKRGVKG